MRQQTMDSRWSTRSLSWIGIRFGQIRRIVDHMCRQIRKAVSKDGIRRAVPAPFVVSCLSLTLLGARLPQGGGRGNVVFLPLIPQGRRTTFYVSPSGDDSNPGTQTQPWRTLNKAATTAIAGDTVVFEDGIYDMGAGQSDWNSGSSGKYITFRARNRRQATWKLTDRGWLVELQSENYLRFEGLVLEGDTSFRVARMFYMNNCDHIVIDDCELKDTQGHIVWARSSTNITVQNSRLHAETHWEHTGLTMEGIYVDGSSSNITIEKCEIYHVSHIGISLHGVNTALVKDCYVHDTSSHCIGIGDDSGSETSTNITIQANTIERAGSWRLASAPKTGIYITKGAGSVDVFDNNIIETYGPGIFMRDECTGPLNIHNNTLYDCLFDYANHGDDWGQVLLQKCATDLNPSITFTNNTIYHTRDSYMLFFEFDDHIEFDYNLYYASTGTEEIYRHGTHNSFASYQAAGYEPHSTVSQDLEFNPPRKP